MELTKQDILQMNNKFDVMKTLKTNPELWDHEVNQHLIKLAKNYLIDNFGSEDVVYDPLPKEYPMLHNK